jgi:Spx/MgsR family transcriptional regulator
VSINTPSNNVATKPTHVTLWGIKNCDTMKKAFAWLDEHGVAYTFHDYKKAGIDAAKLDEWSKAGGWKSLLNTKGTTWRKLSAEDQAIDSQTAAVALMQAKPSVIRRPVIETPGGQLLVGYDPALYSRALEPGGQ